MGSVKKESKSPKFPPKRVLQERAKPKRTKFSKPCATSKRTFPIENITHDHQTQFEIRPQSRLLWAAGELVSIVDHPIPISSSFQVYRKMSRTKHKFTEAEREKERDSKPQVHILRSYFPEKPPAMIHLVEHSWRKKFSLLRASRGCPPIHLLDRLVEGSGKPWGGRALGREGDPINRAQTAGQHSAKRSVSMREEVVCVLQRGSSGHWAQLAWNTAVFQVRIGLVTTTWKLDRGGVGASKVQQT